jgi:hypothetical protein
MHKNSKTERSTVSQSAVHLKARHPVNNNDNIFVSTLITLIAYALHNITQNIHSVREKLWG